MLFTCISRMNLGYSCESQVEHCISPHRKQLHSQLYQRTIQFPACGNCYCQDNHQHVVPTPYKKTLPAPTWPPLNSQHHGQPQQPSRNDTRQQ